MPSIKKNIVLIGYGYWGNILSNQLNKIKKINFIGACDFKKKNLSNFKKNFPDKKIFKNLNDIYKEKKIDAVIIATNYKSLAEIAIKMLNNNINCFIEKPVSKNENIIKKITQVANKKKLICMPGYIFLYNDAIRYIKKILDKKILGRIRTINIERTNLGPFRQDVNAIWDLASHDISILYYFFKKNIKFEHVSKKSFLKKKIEDYANINFSINKKIFGTILCSWLYPKKERKITIVGDKKMLIWNDLDVNKPITIFDKGIFLKKNYVKNFLEYKSYLYSGKETISKINTKEPLYNELNSFISLLYKKKNILIVILH